VARPHSDGFRVIDAFSRIVRLGEGVDRNGALSEAAMARTVQALRICAAKMRRRGATRWRAVATEACRRARNGEAFQDQVERDTGLEIEIISTREEAHLALDGCAPLLDRSVPRALMFDIGGGSTQLMWLGVDAEAGTTSIGWTSLPIGVVNLAERFGGREANAERYAAMIAAVHGALEAFEANHGIADAAAAGRVQMLGTSGTVTTVAGVHLRLPRYNRAAVDGTWLDFDQVERVGDALARLDYRGRVAQPCIGPERADFVVAGCAILIAICRMWPVGRLRIADRGVREGILFGLMREADREAPEHRAAGASASPA